MVVRMVIVFVAMIIVIRVSDRRAYSMHSPFENVIVFFQGSMLGSMVLEPSIPFLSSLGVVASVSLMHWIFARLGIRYEKFGVLLKGKAVPLYENGAINLENLKKMNLSDADLYQGIRKAANTDNLDDIHCATMERDGSISVVVKRRD